MYHATFSKSIKNKYLLVDANNFEYEYKDKRRTATNNAIESWNQSIGTNYNIWRVINKIKTEDSLARSKLGEAVSGGDTEPNPARKNRRTERLSGLKTALQRFDADNLKKFLFALRGYA